MAFFRNIATLITGTTVAQAIPIAISPILTRIYTPEEFGLLALYISITSIFSVIATFRYELTIVQVQDDKDARSLIQLSFFLISIVSFFSLIFAVAYNVFDWNFLQNPDIGKWLYLAPLSIFLIGTYNVCNYWLLRKNSYQNMANGKMIQGGSISFFQVFIGFFKSTGLIVGQILGQLLSVIYIYFSSKEKWKGIKRPALKQCLDNAKVYKKMPIYSTPGAFADNLSLQMPIFMISYFFGTYITGIFSFTFRMLNMPSALISAAVSQVLYKKINEAIQDTHYNIMGFVLKVFSILLALILPFAIFVWLFGEPIFAFVFGEEWRKAGAIASILVIAVVIRFSVSPLSSILSIEKNIKLGVSWQFTYLMTICTTLFLFRKAEITTFLWAFVVHELFLYSLYFLIILIGANRLQGNK